MRQRGFTLIEMLIVISIIGLLAVLITPKLLGVLGQAKRTKATQDIQTLGMAIEMYTVHNGKPPTTEQGLKALVEKTAAEPVPSRWQAGGYLKQKLVQKDPWGHEYVYVAPGLHDPDFDILCYGADGMPGGTGDDADIESWNLEGTPAK
ncbi:MAG: type II secretion system protein GspG [Candidatus Lindowbacteria bacterium RIFCSPLOWO2_12_FULL_62_27]|nr:MAG: type II secretion system protein GspG [Candidatus Lindowbacteria bacterium RIFCSPLOWO2_02_FULL_62_12]OGH62790.1 MAG: type II secretion system protein GspG [Candidatus Lindowbacteria bacterium RIFCSPLOWO2_12_FULL_62_27]